MLRGILVTLPKNEAAEHIKAEKDVFCCLFYDKKWKKIEKTYKPY
ncbi:hypothetical protein [Blautia obeum]|nr:hypothetical protein [Blautia obeum]